MEQIQIVHPGPDEIYQSYCHVKNLEKTTIKQNNQIDHGDPKEDWTSKITTEILISLKGFRPDGPQSDSFP